MAIRVLHIDAGTSWRGGQHQALLLARGLRDRGIEGVIVAQPGSPLAERAAREGLRVERITMRGDLDVAAARRLRAVIRETRVDLVHAHNGRAHAIALLALAVRGAPPLLVARRVAIPPKRSRLKYGARVARFIAVSHAVERTLIAAGVEPERIEVVHGGVPAPAPIPPRDWRGELGWPEETILCGLVGAMTGEKGIDMLEAIAGRLDRSVARRAGIILLGGSAPSPADRSAPIGGVRAVRAGFVEEIDAAVAGLDMLWHPATSEGLGTALIDALARGVPPIAFAVGGIPEVVVDGECGLLVEPGDVAGFAAAAVRLLEDEALRRRLAAAGPARAAEFGVDRMVEKTVAIYRSLREK